MLKKYSFKHAELIVVKINVAYQITLESNLALKYEILKE